MYLLTSSFRRTLGASRRFSYVAMLISLASMPAFFASNAEAHDVTIGAITIASPWSRATPPGAKTGAGYLSLANHGSEADRLVSATSPAARKVEIHQMSVNGGIMQMKLVEDGMVVPAHGAIALEPGHYHLMLIDIFKPFEEGNKIPLTLTFEKAGSVDVDFDVGRADGTNPPHGTNGQDGKSHAN